MSLLFVLLQDAPQKSDGSPIPYLAAAYIAIFVLMFAFMVYLQRRQRRNRDEMQKLQTRLDETARELARLNTAEGQSNTPAERFDGRALG